MLVYTLGQLLTKKSGLELRLDAFVSDHAAKSRKTSLLNLEDSALIDWLSQAVDKIVMRTKNHQKAHDHLKQQFMEAGIRNKRARTYYYLSKFSLPILALFSLVSLYFIKDGSIAEAKLLFIFGAIGVVILYFAPDLYIKNKIQKRHKEVQKHWQDVLELMIICVESGLSVEASLRRVTTEIAASAPDLADELAITLAEISMLPERRKAFANLAERLPLPSVKSATLALIQAETQGASIGYSLRMIAGANRDTRISAVEQRAAALGPKLTLPLVVFFLPVLFVVIIVPLFLNASF